jgi:hypothetical protein
MLTTQLILSISPEQIITAVQQLEKIQQEALVEDLLAAISPAYLDSIREARQDYQAGRLYSHDEVFD